MLVGILLLSNIFAYVLFDSGVIHSFISAAFVAKSNVACVKTDNDLEASFPLERILCFR